MNKSTLNALIKLYDEIGLSYTDVIRDMKYGYLTENTCRNGRDVLWYMDVCIYIDTLEFLTEAEIDDQLL